LFSGTSFHIGYNLFVFINIVSSPKTGIFTPFVFNNFLKPSGVFNMVFLEASVAKHDLTHLISMRSIFARSCLSTDNSFILRHIVSCRGHYSCVQTSAERAPPAIFQQGSLPKVDAVSPRFIAQSVNLRQKCLPDSRR